MTGQASYPPKKLTLHQHHYNRIAGGEVAGNFFARWPATSRLPARNAEFISVSSHSLMRTPMNSPLAARLLAHWSGFLLRWFV
ncbi:hypothetical protein PATSB16_00550 [Pandoraea thiooxydans]|uniref:Uncharacterized protein n=1 Tax=Pandoraea thiooxydans TaxID=445709 RepID=A0A0G3EX83_9BURK|nr:hypothetical protein ABW99_19060 [Pandoraea thiooxydans]APR93399.1 hypothetical protein PATSB16_00550 [Pandoraea thiooxydans]